VPTSRIILFFALGLSTFASCKPSDDTSTPQPAPVISGRFYTYYENSTTVHSTADTFWWSGATIRSTVDGHNIWVKNIELNDIPFDKLSSITSNNYITRGIPIHDSIRSSASWVIEGTDEIPSFTYNHRGPNPNCVSAVPDTFDLKNGLTIRFNSSNTFNADSIHLECSQDGIPRIIKSAAVSDVDIYISNSELTNFQPGKKCLVSIDLTNYTTQKFEGRYFSFIRLSRYYRSAYAR
jgi:hypothetical protein